jgi:hypothetical protein
MVIGIFSQEEKKVTEKSKAFFRCDVAETQPLPLLSQKAGIFPALLGKAGP